MDRPKVLVVAGYDQSAGAGVLSDIKTLEAHRVYGYGVCTGITFQNETAVRRVDWLRLEDITAQIDLCYESSGFSWVKMGITPSAKVAAAIIDHLRLRNPAIKVILDPVIRSSSGADFWGATPQLEWEALAARCYLVTPNWEEIEWLYPA
ncbi:MAG TPA: bifunctional hydroxymethylpyrimidine kinase/phosphomethylpyrimidine kinase, partial [Puia sp.]|nr:bifunctional hydroxymethylpyrimidine kinase/phosphomethylpyrimidine kinase [Puia sp.]